MLQEMQLAFWETVVVVVGNDYFSYDLLAQLLQHSLEKNPQDMFIEDKEVIEKIKQDDNFKNKMNEIVNKYGNKSNLFEITDNDKQGFTFDNSDLYFSIHGVQVNLKARKNGQGKWVLDIILHDRYDYTDFKDFLQYYNDANSVQKSIIIIYYTFLFYEINFCTINSHLMATMILFIPIGLIITYVLYKKQEISNVLSIVITIILIILFGVLNIFVFAFIGIE